MKQRFFRTLRKLAAATVALSVLLLASCNSIEDDEATAPAQNVRQGELVKIYLDLAQTARSAFATIEREEFVTLELTCDGAFVEMWAKDDETGFCAYDMMAAAGIDAPAGEHTLTLTGTINGGTTYSDTVTQTLSEGSKVSFELALDKISGTGHGSLELNITYPTDDVHSVGWKLYRIFGKKKKFF